MTDAVVDPAPISGSSDGAFITPLSSANLGWRIFRNTAGPIAGRVAIAATRLAIAALIVRYAGVTAFGEYSLLLGIFLIAEWILDFGTTEIFVREICREPSRARYLLGVLMRTKLVQLPASVLILAIIVLGLRYPAHILQAAAVGALSLIAFGAILVYRVVFKAALNMDREVAAELLSVLAMVPMVAMVTRNHWGLSALLACHVASRLVFLTFCALFAGRRLPQWTRTFAAADIKWGLAQSSAIGFAGFLVVLYESVDLVLLSRLSSVSDVAYYSAAQRFIGPVLMAVYAVGATLYPVAASYWPHARTQFDDACQRGFDAVLILAGAAVCVLIAGAEVIIGFMGHPLLPAARALMVLAALCLIKGLSATVGPLLYILQSQTSALKLIAIALVVKALAIISVAPRYGFLGVAYTVLGVELLFSLVPTLYLLRVRAGFVVRWRVPLLVLVITAVAAVIPRLYLRQSIAALAAAFCIYVIGILATRVVTESELRALLKRKAA